MATIFTPTVNKIYRMTYFDLLRTKIEMGNMYMCVDTNVLWYDGGNTENDRKIVDYIEARTINQLFNEITPSYGKNYYCWEDNSLWIWLNKWQVIYSDTTYPSAYNYNGIPTIDEKLSIEPIYRYDMPNMPADDNGLLKDGSVVVRDRNRIIKGKISVSDQNDNLIIASFLGGGIRLLPNGKMSSDGEFYIDSVLNEITQEQEMKASLRAQLTILNNEMYIDYSEHPEKDDNEYQNQEHRYKLYHQGNLDISGIEVMTPTQTYNLLVNQPELPNEFDFNVNRLGGHEASFFAQRVHSHNVNDIDGLYNLVQQQAGTATRSIFNNMVGVGITGSYDTVEDVLTLTANNFQISLSGGVTGNALVRGLSSTVIETTVDPTKHNHTNYEQTMASLQNQIDAIDIDTSFTYTKQEIDSKVDSVRPTINPTPNKALALDINSILQTTAKNAQALDHNVQLNLLGDITGTITTNYSQAQLDITTQIDTTSIALLNVINQQIANRNYKTIIGDGTSTAYTIMHNLNSTDIIVQCIDNQTRQIVNIATNIVDNNSIQVISHAPLTNNQVTVLVYKVV